MVCFVLFIIPLSYLFLPFTASAYSLAFCGVFCPIYHPFVLFIPAIYGFCSLVSFLWSVLSYLSFVLFIPAIYASAYSLAFCGVFCPIYHPFVPPIYGFCSLFSFLCSVLSYLFLPFTASAYSLAFCGVFCPIYHPFVLFIPAIYLFLPFTASAHSLAFCGVVLYIILLTLYGFCFFYPFVLFILPIYGFCSLFSFLCVFCPIYHPFVLFIPASHLRILLTLFSFLCSVLSYLFLPFTASAYSLAFCGVFCPIYHPFVLFIPAIYGFCLLFSFLWCVLSYLSSLCPIYSSHLRLLLTL